MEYCIYEYGTPILTARGDNTLQMYQFQVY